MTAVSSCVTHLAALSPLSSLHPATVWQWLTQCPPLHIRLESEWCNHISQREHQDTSPGSGPARFCLKYDIFNWFLTYKNNKQQQQFLSWSMVMVTWWCDDSQRTWSSRTQEHDVALLQSDVSVGGVQNVPAPPLLRCLLGSLLLHGCAQGVTMGTDPSNLQ